MKRNDTTRAIENELARRRIKTWRYEPGSKHPRVVIEHRDRTIVIPFSPTTANRNARHAVLRQLRRELAGAQ